MDNYVHFIEQFEKIGTELRTTRSFLGMSQEETAAWLNTDRRNIMSIESGKCLNLKLICEYSDRLGLELKLNINKI